MPTSLLLGFNIRTMVNKEGMCRMEDLGRDVGGKWKVRALESIVCSQIHPYHTFLPCEGRIYNYKKDAPSIPPIAKIVSLLHQNRPEFVTTT